MASKGRLVWGADLDGGGEGFLVAESMPPQAESVFRVLHSRVPEEADESEARYALHGG